MSGTNPPFARAISLAALIWAANIDASYHIDYTFVSRPDAVEHVKVGSHEAWIAHSDHSPMTVNLRCSHQSCEPSGSMPQALVMAEQM